MSSESLVGEGERGIRPKGVLAFKMFHGARIGVERSMSTSNNLLLFRSTIKNFAPSSVKISTDWYYG